MGLLLFSRSPVFSNGIELEVKTSLVMVGILKVEGMRLFGGIRSVVVA